MWVFVKTNGTHGEHQNRWYMDVHPPQNGGIGYDPWPSGHVGERERVEASGSLAFWQTAASIAVRVREAPLLGATHLDHSKEVRSVKPHSGANYVVQALRHPRRGMLQIERLQLVDTR